jgi:hypothetical protein
MEICAPQSPELAPERLAASGASIKGFKKIERAAGPIVRARPRQTEMSRQEILF